MNNWTKQVLSSFAAEVRDDVEYQLSPNSIIWSECESPIELAFAVAFSMCSAHFQGRPSRRLDGFVSSDAPHQFIVPQVKVDQYRVDFVVGWNIGDLLHTAVAVECDGHDFHERTKQQAARDKARDRFLSQNFARVLRFTGSEIYKNPCKCAVEVMGISDQLLWDYVDRSPR